jgi:hypothetical protein
MHHLEFEKIVDSIEKKYEAVVKMSVIARKLSGQEPGNAEGQRPKITTSALKAYITTSQSANAADTSRQA